MNDNKIKLVFFGGSQFSVYVLNELKLHGILPELIVTTPDKPKGRKLVLTPTPVKVWGQNNGIEVIDPLSLKKPCEIGGEEITADKYLSKEDWDLFLVASYGKIIPKEVFQIPSRKTLNVHPSMLPKYRGASPLQSQILEDENDVGVTIMQIDEGIDTGAIIIQKEIEFEKWPIGRKEIEKVLAIEGARLFTHILPEWMQEAIDPIMQDDSKATYCQKIEKEDGELKIDLNKLPEGIEAYNDLLKIKAFEEWPTTYFFTDRGGRDMRVIITDAKIEDDKLKILKVIPEGKKEMSFEDFLRGQK